MMLAGKKVVVVGGSSGIRAFRPLNSRPAKARKLSLPPATPIVWNAAAASLGARAITADVTSDESVVRLFRALRAGRSCRDHRSPASCSGPFKTVAMEDVRATMEGKFWGAWRIARSAEILPGGSTHAGLWFPEYSSPTQLCDRRRRKRRDRVTDAVARARTCACARQLCLARDHRHADPRGVAGSRASRHTRQDPPPVCRSAGSAPAQTSRGMNPRLHDDRLCNGIEIVYVDGGALII